MNIQEHLKTLNNFNVKAKKLKESNFTKTLLEKKIGVKISWKKDENLKVEIWGPDDDEIATFVLTFRFFIQKNEEISIRNMAKIYNELPISAERKESFRDVRKKLNDFLYSKSRIEKDSSTNNDIMRIFIYGDLAHMNKKKKEIYDKWKSIPILNELLSSEFVLILGEVLRVIVFIQNLNNEVIKELEVSE